MNTRISYLSCIVLGLIFPGAAVSQSMGDRSSVYNAMWFDDTNVYVTGQIAGSMSVHIYAVDLTLQTPSGTKGLRGIVWVKNADFEPETPLPIRPGKGPDRN